MTCCGSSMTKAADGVVQRTNELAAEIHKALASHTPADVAAALVEHYGLTDAEGLMTLRYLTTKEVIP